MSYIWTLKNKKGTMATVRQLKQEVDYMVCSVLLDCEAHLSRSTEHKAEVLLLVDDVFQLGS